MAITVSSSAVSGQELLVEVDEDLAEFEEFFREELDNQPLTPAEKAIIKTYLHWASIDRHRARKEPSGSSDRHATAVSSMRER